MGKIPGFLSAHKHAPQREKVMNHEWRGARARAAALSFFKRRKKSKTAMRKCQLIQTSGGRGTYVGKLQVSGYRMR